jgi:hypothetical protein
MTLEVQYNMTVDLINPNNNVSSKYPLVQGTKPKIILTIKEDGTIHNVTNLSHVEMAVIHYCKLDGSGIIKKLQNADITIQNGELEISGTDLTSTPGKNALIFKYTNGYTSYSQPLYYEVIENPMYNLTN